ncbi:hypothetical protein A2392_01470 [Candidatus Kaiserbacteria bacterium RIFOXYB1_FULL_46_14]|uniref:Segregation and condensation protein A n=1 Tax=Candidatus Kaiserbacteria bacterium RIFOXYB1_FULL_46_14 TaxID=1798531 RepID=A0A1F6FJS1_9BACT|nr:MAG: hypothetical protein A2392_01470 [Candidatus Kaiserbacteria bacterium RIFOXYB1_FULL_46_14]
MTIDFSIKTEVFEGPLELLLELVEKRKLLINDISLATVTDEFMARVSEMQEMSLPGTANFVALAATLLLIKSKSLLPVFELSEEEEHSIEELEERLRLYQIYRTAGEVVRAAFGVKVSHERQYIPDTTAIFLPDQFCTSDELRNAMSRVISELPIKEIKPRVQIKKVVSLEEMIDRLHQRIEKQLKLRFSELVAGEEEKHGLIVGFLAVLESVKQGSILVSQLSRFDDIEIEYSKPQLPRYF